MGNFANMVGQSIEVEDIATYLNNLTHEERLDEVQSFPGKLEEKLYGLASANLNPADLIPRDYPPLEQVIFYGKNSLPMFSKFQKRMCRSLGGNEIWGYNHQSMSPITGPGYFVITDQTDKPGEVTVDYTKTPKGSVVNWPSLKSNNKGIGKLVYGNLKDYLRKVSNNIFIGEAIKDGKKVGYFLLCRPSF